MIKFRIQIIISFLFCTTIIAQTKNERESRIKASKFPENAIEVLKVVPKEAKRTKYYREIDGSKKSFESKFKYNHHWYSIEFDSLGKLEDIEIKIKEGELPRKTLKNIENYLDKNSEKSDIIKIQEQYLYNPQYLETELLKNLFENRSEVISNYELILALRVDKIWKLQEVTFDSLGNFLSKRTIKPDSYEYIMY